jgi:threonine dehydrogenase-like Zn-dependent dehydrogenase
MTRQMAAVVKAGGKTTLREVPVPVVRSPEELIVRVMEAGICRTDLLAADNGIETSETLILGHEVSGIVEASGNGASTLREGDRVAVNPIGPCRRCERCAGGDESNCLTPTFLGLRRDGAFAELVRVSRDELFKLPDSLPFAHGAYAEPVAAVLAVLNAGIRPEERGLICGTNRIARLLQRVLAAKGFGVVECAEALEDLREPAGRYDYAIEVSPKSDHFHMMLQAIRPRGKILLRSRIHEEVTLPLHQALPKEPVIHVVNYGSFQEAVDLLASRAIDVTDLLGPRYPLSAFAEAFAAAKSTEANKVFFSIGSSR